MRRLDHTMIFVLIAGSYTPFRLVVLRGIVGTVILVAVLALVGAVFKLVWIDAPGRLIAAASVAIAWIGVIAIPGLVDHLGITAVAAFGARRRSLPRRRGDLRAPATRPRTDGVRLPLFHLLVIVAAAVQYAVVAVWVM